jgi:hypothetical protein
VLPHYIFLKRYNFFLFRINFTNGIHISVVVFGEKVREGSTLVGVFLEGSTSTC